MTLKLNFYATLEQITLWTGNNLWSLREKDREQVLIIYMLEKKRESRCSRGMVVILPYDARWGDGDDEVSSEG